MDYNIMFWNSFIKNNVIKNFKSACQTCHTYVEKYKKIKLTFCSHGAYYYLTFVLSHVSEQFKFKIRKNYTFVKFQYRHVSLEFVVELKKNAEGMQITPLYLSQDKINVKNNSTFNKNDEP